MKQIWNMIQVVFAAIGGSIGWFVGGCDGMLIALIVFVVADYITGVACGIYEKKLSSSIAYKGIAKKVFIFVLVGVGNILDTYILGGHSALRGAVIMFYMSAEGISILENAGRLGLPVPPKVKSVLEQLHEASEDIDIVEAKEENNG